MKHFIINQLKHEMDVPVNIIYKIYDNIIKQEQTESEYDDTTTFDGEVTVNAPAYQEYVNKIQSKFPLIIHLTQYYILFKDTLVRDILVNSTYCTDHIGITNDDAITITKLGTGNVAPQYYTQLFQNTDIETFDELNLLTNLVQINFDDFRNCTKLKSINLQNIKSIGGQAFAGCTNLKIDINLPNISTLGGGVFYNSGITSVTDLGPISVLSRASGTGWSHGLFGACINLETVHLSNNIKEIQTDCFSGCTSLRELNLPTSITKLGGSVFSNCIALENTLMYLPNVTSIGFFNWHNTFIDILYLNSLTTTPNGYYSSYQYYDTAFGSNRAGKSYKYIYLKDIKSLGVASFARVTITALIINNDTPPTINTDGNKDAWTGITEIDHIYVPDSKVDTYKEDEAWLRYADIIEGISTFPKVGKYEEYIQREDKTCLIAEYM